MYKLGNKKYIYDMIVNLVGIIEECEKYGFYCVNLELKDIVFVEDEFKLNNLDQIYLL